MAKTHRVTVTKAARILNFPAEQVRDHPSHDPTTDTVLIPKGTITESLIDLQNLATTCREAFRPMAELILRTLSSITARHRRK